LNKGRRKEREEKKRRKKEKKKRRLNGVEGRIKASVQSLENGVY